MGEPAQPLGARRDNQKNPRHKEAGIVCFQRSDQKKAVATYIPYTPTTVIAKAMFNFDAFGIADYKLTGTVNVSVSR